MKISKKNLGIIVVGVLISFFSYSFRSKQFFSFPPVNDTRDEYKYAFNGISLIKEGVPKSWSWFDDYKNFEIKEIRGSDYRIVNPYFDDPPLFSLIMGGYAISKGMDSFEKVDAGALRWPMLKLGAINVFMLYILVYLVSGFWEAVVSSLLYATIPTMVLSSRLPLAENFLITLSLSCLILLYIYIKYDSKISLWFLFVLSGIAVLIKQTGIYIPGALFFLLIGFKKIKPALGVVLSTLFFVLIWFAYGLYYDWPLFLHMQTIFSGREINFPTMVINLFDTFRISEKSMSVDGWLIWGWMCVYFFSFFKKRRKIKEVYFLLMPASYLLIFAIMSGHLKGWYRFPFHPFLSWAMAAFLIELIRMPRLLPVIGFFAIPGFASLISGTGEAVWSNYLVKIYQFIFPVVLLPFFLFETMKKNYFKHICQFFIIIVFVLMIYLNFLTIYNFQDQFWY